MPVETKAAPEATVSPICCLNGHPMEISDFHGDQYGSNCHICDKCRSSGNSERWLCLLCTSDFCFACVPRDEAASSTAVLESQDGATASTLSAGSAGGAEAVGKIVDEPAAAARAFPGTSSPVVAAEWACPVCTYYNGATVPDCDMCGAPKATSARPVALAALAPAPTIAVPRGPSAAGGAEWGCPTCTFANKPSSGACEMCDTPAPPHAALAYAPAPDDAPVPDDMLNAVLGAALNPEDDSFKKRIMDLILSPLTQYMNFTNATKESSDDEEPSISMKSSAVEILADLMESGDVQGLNLALETHEREVDVETAVAVKAEILRHQGVLSRFRTPGLGSGLVHFEVAEGGWVAHEIVNADGLLTIKTRVSGEIVLSNLAAIQANYIASLIIYFYS